MSDDSNRNDNKESDKTIVKHKVILLSVLITLLYAALIIAFFLLIMNNVKGCAHELSSEPHSSESSLLPSSEDPHPTERKIVDNLKIICNNGAKSHDNSKVQRFYNLNYSSDKHYLYLTASVIDDENKINVYTIDLIEEYTIEETLNHLIDYSDYQCISVFSYNVSASSITTNTAYQQQYKGTTKGINFKNLVNVNLFSGIVLNESRYTVINNLIYQDKGLDTGDEHYMRNIVNESSPLYYSFTSYLYL